MSLRFGLPHSLSAIGALVAGLMFLPQGVALADPSVFSELSKTIKAPSAVAQLGPDLFGDKVNLYNGSLTFEQTDVNLPGTGAIQVKVGRRLTPGKSSLWEGGHPFGVWDLDIPYVYGVFASTKGWTNAANSTARCTSFSAPPPFLYQSAYTFEAKDYWQGNMLHIPDGGDQLIMLRNSTNANYPSDGQSYPLVTSQLWAFSCLATLANGTGAGEGFLAVAPNGTRYRFDQMVSITAPTLYGGTNGLGSSLVANKTAFVADKSAKPGTSANPILNAAGQGSMARKEVRLYPTLITDRNGNTVTFTYDSALPGNLKKISGSDGRTLTFTYGNSSAPHLITSVTDGVRTWNYSYSGSPLNLDTVTQPDGSTWKLAGIASLFYDINFIASASCDLPANYDNTAHTGSMTHPSGAIATFTLTPTTHGRSNVQQQCLMDSTGAQWPQYPQYFYTQSLTNKTITGPGLSTLSWSYNYGAPNASWDTCTSNCPSTKTVTVNDPSSFVTRYTFSNVYQRADGKLVQTDEGWSGNSALRTTQQTYRVRTSSDAYPESLGSSGTNSIGDADMAERPRPLEQKIITQQGVSFAWTAAGFDSRVRPTSISKSSSLGSRTENTVYSDNTAKWVLSQIGSVTESSTGKVMVQNTYDTSTADLLQVRNFGLLKETRTYNTDGTLWTSKDGLNQTTTYSNYKLGIPQLTTFANNQTQSAVVSSIGLVTSMTDELGYTSSYGYDSMGRLSSITYPPADSVAWNPTTINFSQVQAAEYGIAAGHWRKTVATGNGTEVTYFDALWRPLVSRRYDAANEANTRSMVLRRFDYHGATTFESYPQSTITAISDTVNGITYSLDALGRVTNSAADSELGVLNTAIAYGTGFKKTVTNARGYATVYGYQAFDTPTEDALTSIVQPYGFTTTIGRDVFGKTTSIYKGDINDSATRSYVYDVYGRLCKTIEPEIGATVLDYDAASNVAWRAIGVALPSTTSCDQASVTASKKITYGYDTRNRLKTTTYGDGSPSITRTLFGDGLPETVSSNGTVWTYVYNKRRLLQSESLAYAGKTYNIGHGYDANGAAASLSYPGASALSLDYAPNALGQPTKVGGYAYNITYSPTGALHFFNYGSGMQHSRIENVRGMTSRVRDEGVMFDEYTYDQNGNVTGVSDLQEGVSTRTMGYDAVDRLQTATANGAGMWGTASYLVDAVDNIRTINITSGTNTRNITLNYDTSKRLASISGTMALNLGYDSQGNITSRGAASYVFDQGNRMSSATGKSSYVYDGWGRRVKVAKVDGTTVVQVYSMEGQLLYGSTAVGTATPAESRYIYLKGHLLAEAGVAYIHTDGLGSPIARTSPTGALLSRTRYEPYGLTAAGTAPATFGFAGHVNDTETALVYMQQRYYDPLAGRFLSTDPVMTDSNTSSSFNRYAYANNSPYKYVDPDGRDSCVAQPGGGQTCTYSVNTTLGGAAVMTAGAAIWNTGVAIYNQASAGDKSNSVSAASAGVADKTVERKDAYVVRVQAQGTSLKNETSVPITSSTPIKAEAVQYALGVTAAGLTSKEQVKMASAFSDASNWVNKVAAAGGISPDAARSRTFPVPGKTATEARVDVEVIKGHNIVP